MRTKTKTLSIVPGATLFFCEWIKRLTAIFLYFLFLSNMRFKISNNIQILTINNFSVKIVESWKLVLVDALKILSSCLDHAGIKRFFFLGSITGSIQFFCICKFTFILIHCIFYYTGWNQIQFTQIQNNNVVKVADWLSWTWYNILVVFDNSNALLKEQRLNCIVYL